MRLSELSATALTAAGCASAFANTSPFFLVSTNSIDISHGFPSLSSASSIQDVVDKSLRSCPSHNYILVSQPGASSTDFTQGKAQDIMPGISRMWADEKTHSSRYSVNDVVGLINHESWITTLTSACKLQTIAVDKPSLESLPDIWKGEQVVQITFPPLSSKPEQRRQQLLNHDAYLEAFTSQIKSKGYTLLYYSGSADVTDSRKPKQEMEDYEMDESPLVGVLHSDLKRNVGSLHRRQDGDGNQTIIEGPLFAKYQFLSPGIFMGGLVSLLLLSMAYVGISALSSLQVTYAAFDKDQGPPSSKKAQ